MAILCQESFVQQICRYMPNHKKVSAIKAIKLIGYVRGFYRSQGLGEIGHIELHVLSRKDMAKLYGNNVEGIACSFGVINMLRDVEPSRFCEIFAHELLHIWQYEHGYFEVEPSIYEGFCNLGSYLFLKRVGTEGCLKCAESLLYNPDPIYGQGFRDMLIIYKQSGWKGCIRKLEKAKL